MLRKRSKKRLLKNQWKKINQRSNVKRWTFKRPRRMSESPPKDSLSNLSLVSMKVSSLTRKVLHFPKQMVQILKSWMKSTPRIPCECTKSAKNSRKWLEISR
uniref:Uncharacterized protein n=1 Tax=Cacopsylla melanoneura TaxID=428564 RepID=A0A8D8QKA3_9HEMI